MVIRKAVYVVPVFESSVSTQDEVCVWIYREKVLINNNVKILLVK